MVYTNIEGSMSKMDEKKEREMEELAEEIDIIFSVKDNISQSEINNFLNKFTELSEDDIRKKISEITGDNSYIENSSSDQNDKNSTENIDSESCSEVKVEDSPEELDEDKIENVNDDLQLHIDELPEKSEDNKIKPIFDDGNIPDVPFVRAEIKYGQLSLEWGWPEGIDKVLLCCRMDRFPEASSDSSASHVIIEREEDFETGDYTISKIEEGNYYFCIYAVVEYENKTLYSEGQRRLVVNKVPQEIFYEIDLKKSLLGKLKSAKISLSSASSKSSSKDEIELPQLVLISKIGNMPIQKSDGETLFNIDYETLKNDEIMDFELPIENIRKNMYVKLFFVDDSNSKLYRIVSPAKEKLYFK